MSDVEQEVSDEFCRFTNVVKSSVFTSVPFKPHYRCTVLSLQKMQSITF